MFEEAFFPVISLLSAAAPILCVYSGKIYFSFGQSPGALTIGSIFASKSHSCHFKWHCWLAVGVMAFDIIISGKRVYVYSKQ